MEKSDTRVTVISKIDGQRQSHEAALVVIHGADLGRKYDLKHSETIIGRSSKVDIQVNEDSISRSHASLMNDGSRVLVHDMGSTNGTFVNDEPVSGDVVLRNGDLLRIGRTIFKFIAGGNVETAYHEEIYRLTTVDGLTQIFNRRYFEETLEREMSRCARYGRELSLVMMDVDHFKRINDAHGHLAGDYVLKQLASSLRTRIRREDVFARYGGEEFALILPEVDGGGALAMAEKVRRLVESQTFEFERHVIPVTLSLGVAALPPGKPVQPADLIHSADEKLYEAKAGGRNQVRG